MFVNMCVCTRVHVHVYIHLYYTNTMYMCNVYIYMYTMYITCKQGLLLPYKGMGNAHKMCVVITALLVLTRECAIMYMYMCTSVMSVCVCECIRMCMFTYYYTNAHDAHVQGHVHTLYIHCAIVELWCL